MKSGKTEQDLNELLKRIEINPKVLAGKPIIRGTRLSVDFILSLFAQSWSEEEILKNYPHLKKEDLQAVFYYAYLIIKDEQVLPLSK